MKTLLLILLLNSSIEIPSSKVADSPPEKSLHRSTLQPVSPHSGDTHRGGAILPDTFTRIDFGLVDSDQDIRVGMEKEYFHSTSVPVFPSQNKQEVARQALESQSLVSSVACAERSRSMLLDTYNGLVDSDQDMGAGEQTHNLDPAPVTVFGPPLPQTKNSPNQFSLELSGVEASDIRHPKSEIELWSSSQDMGAANQTYNLEPSPVTVFLVHRIPESAGNLVVDLWDAEMYGLDNFANHQRMEVPAMDAHMLTGMMPREERGYRFRTPSISTPSILRLSLAHYPVIRDFRVSPGDSVMIKVNEKSASLIFTGPSAPKFRLQKELNEVVYAFSQGIDVGLSFNSEPELQAYLDRPGNRAAWDSISNSFGRKTILKVAGQPELEYLQGLNFQKSVLELKSRLDLYRDKVPGGDLQAIYAGAVGSIYQIYLGKLSSGFTGAVKLGDPDLTQRFRDFIQTQISTLPEGVTDTDANESATFREYLIACAVLKARISDSDFFDTVFESYSQEVAERLSVQYLSDTRRRLKDFENQAISLDVRLKSPEMKSVLAEMTGRFGQGAPLFSFDLPTLDGNRITPKDFEGKAMLIDFWITGCGACKSFHERIFDPLIEKYSERPGLQIISVCADRNSEYWELQGGTPNVSNKGFIPAYAERSSDSNPLLSHYNIHSYPQMMLVRPDGTLFRLSRVPASLAEAEQLIEEAMKPTEPTKSNSSPTKSPDL